MKRYYVKYSPFRFYDVKAGYTGTAIETRFQGSSVEAICLRINKTDEDHWFRVYQLEPIN